jgi:hypothetical protein
MVRDEAGLAVRGVGRCLLGVGYGLAMNGGRSDLVYGGTRDGAWKIVACPGSLSSTDNTQIIPAESNGVDAINFRTMRDSKSMDFDRRDDSVRIQADPISSEVVIDMP